MRSRFLPGCIAAFLSIASAHAQVDSLPKQRSVWRLGGGTGFVIPLGLPPAIFRQVGLNFQLGIVHEYYWQRRLSLLVGADFRLQSLVADARFVAVPSTGETGNRIEAQPAPDSVKYALLRYQMVSIPVLVRYYIARNAVRRLFVDAGVSLNFPMTATYRYRTNGLPYQNNLIGFVPQPIVLIELATGANGQVFGGRLTKANNLLGALLFGGFVSVGSSVYTQQGNHVVVVGFMTKFVF